MLESRVRRGPLEGEESSNGPGAGGASGSGEVVCLRGRRLGTGEWSLGMEGGLSVLAGALESAGAGGGARDPSASDSLFCSL